MRTKVNMGVTFYPSHQSAGKCRVPFRKYITSQAGDFTAMALEQGVTRGSKKGETRAFS